MAGDSYDRLPLTHRIISGSPPFAGHICSREPGKSSRVYLALVRTDEAAMNVFSKLVLWVVLCSLLAFGAKAQGLQQQEPQQDVQAANTLICGTADHAKRFVTLNQDIQRALAEVNDSGRSSSCLMAAIAFIPGKQVDRVAHKDGTYAVTEILIVGVGTPYGMLATEPSVVYTVVKVSEEAA